MRSEKEVEKDFYLAYPHIARRSTIKKNHDLIYFCSAYEFKGDDNIEPEYYLLAQALLTAISNDSCFRYLVGVQGNKGHTKIFHADIQELPDLSLGNYIRIKRSEPRTKDFRDFADLIKPHLVIVSGLPKELDQEKINFVIKKKAEGFIWDNDIRGAGLWPFYSVPEDYQDYKYIFSETNKLKRGIFFTPEIHAKRAALMIPRKIKYVWDPFCGNRGLLKFVPEGIKTFGSDLNPVDASITKADFFNLKPDDIPEEIRNDMEHSFILTNPTFEDDGCDKTIDVCLKLKIKFGLFVLDNSLKERPLPIIDGFYTYANDTNKELAWPELCEIGGGQTMGIPFLIFDPYVKPVNSIKIGNNIFECVKPVGALYEFRWQKIRAKIEAYDTKGKFQMICNRLRKFPELFGRFPTKDDIEKYYDPKWAENFKGKNGQPAAPSTDFQPALIKK